MRPRGVNAGVLFERNLNTFNWIGSAAVDTAIGPVDFEFSDQYTSNIILIEPSGASAEQRLQSNRHEIYLLPAWKLADMISLQTRWSSLVYSDAKAVGLSTASFNSLLGGVAYRPFPFLLIAPMAGSRWDNQAGIRDRGLSYDITMSTVPSFLVDGYKLEGALRYNKDHLDPRTIENHLAKIGMQKTLTGRTRDSLEVQFSRNRREFYSLSGSGTEAAIDTNIESRVDDLLQVSNLLEYELSPRILTSFFIGVTDRVLDKDFRYTRGVLPESPQFGTQIEEFFLHTYVEARYQSADGSSFALARLLFDERNETHSAKSYPGVPDALFREANETEKTKDNLTRRTVLTGTARTPLSRSDALSLSGSASILRYDTPHDLNVEDRDEQLFAIGLTSSHRLSQYLDVNLSLTGSVSHVVYLSGQRSANNNINRVLRFGPRVEYRPYRNAVTANTFEVLANYTVYDFEDRAVLIRSFSYRQFSWLDSTVVPLSRRMSLDFLVHLRLYERGQLQWDEFTERTENAFTDETYAVQVRFVPHPSLTVAAGVRYFAQTRYAFLEGSRTFESRLKSLGPTTMVHWQVNPYSIIGFTGWFEERRQSDGPSRSLPNLTMNVQITF
jgi:hypothetical protein